MILVGHTRLNDIGRRIFTAGGSTEEEAAIIADHLVEANLRGHDSHGVGLIANYLTTKLGWQCTCVTSIDTSHLNLPFTHLNYKVREGPQPKVFYEFDFPDRGQYYMTREPREHEICETCRLAAASETNRGIFREFQPDSPPID